MDFKSLYHYTKDLNLLYIEDDTEIVKQSVELFEMLFSSVTVCSDGEEALNKYHIHKFDIIITDLNMPNINGIELITEILKINPKQHISVISAHNDSSILLKLINLGIDSFLLKPMQEKQLMQTLYKISYNIQNEKISYKYQQKITQSNRDLEIEVKKRTKELKEQLYTDHLTGLKNRNALSHDLKKNRYNMLAIIDIDRLQFINDLYGTDIGNQIIKQFANILDIYARQSSYTIYRTSGDEFTICSIENDKEKFKKFIQNLSEFVIHLPLYIEKLAEEIYIDATIGVSFEKDHLLTHADIALKNAKTTQKPLVVYHESMNTLPKMQNTILWKKKIQYALENDNIIPVFQPIVNNQGEIIKYEALMRIREIDDNEEKLITPYSFLDIAIATKQYNKLSVKLIQKALKSLIKNQCTLSINLTYSDFTDENIIKLLTDNLEKHDIGHRLIFEIVESEDIKDYKLLNRFIKKFKKYGVKIAIDDFGSGFSNFRNIIQTRPDFIKIDGSLIKNIDNDIQAQIMVKAITQVSNELGVKVIAEFVHSKEVLEILKSFNIEQFQGYYFYEPSLELIEEKNTI
jgi:diguanylate cyclase (GGDEF)-like protein